METVFYLLRDDLAEYHLFGEILRSYDDAVLGRATRQQEKRAQAAENRFSIQPNPPSDSSASTAAGTAPANICVVSTDAMPRKMKTPNPPPPMAAAIVAVPTVVTVATRTPARMVGAARRSATCQN